MGFCSTHPCHHLSTYLFTYLNYISKPMNFFWKMLKSFKLFKNGCKSDQFFTYPLLTYVDINQTFERIRMVERFNLFLKAHKSVGFHFLT